MYLSDDFSGFVDTCGTGKRNWVGALVLENGSIGQSFESAHNTDNNLFISISATEKKILLNDCFGNEQRRLLVE